eukprot:1342287-Amorphochlora_amoeboformis.AAC.1
MSTLQSRWRSPLQIPGLGPGLGLSRARDRAGLGLGFVGKDGGLRLGIALPLGLALRSGGREGETHPSSNPQPNLPQFLNKKPVALKQRHAF